MTRPVILSLMVLAVATGCQVLPENTAIIRQYDLGVSAETPVPCKTRLEMVRAPAETTMWYRTGSESFERRPYAWSVWSAAPGDLVRDRIVQRTRPGPEATAITLEIHQMELLVGDDGGRARLAVAVRSGGRTTGLPPYLVDTDVSPAGLARGIAQLVDQLMLDVCAADGIASP